MPVDKIQNPLGNEDWVGKLTFFYYGQDSKPATYTLPFFENPSIVESGAGNYGTLNPIGRAGSLYTYTGSESRRLNVGFNITLPHITQSIREINRLPEGFQTQIQNMKDQMINLGSTGKAFLGTANDPSQSLLGSLAGDRSDVVRDFDTLYEQVLDEASQALLSLKKQTSDVLNAENEGGRFRQKVIAKVAQFLAVIRSSTLNNARDPIYGPPIVRLNWGIAYQDIPCITKSYKIEALPDGGYDAKTLLPRVVRVTMDLEEARNLGRFDKFDEVARDSLGGWEVVFNNVTTDPGTNFINIS